MNRFLDIRSYFNRVGFAFRALKSRNFRLFFYGSMVSLMGTWIQNLALGWLVYRMTDSAFFLGLVGFAGQIPSLVLTPIAGVYADRLNRRKVLIITQTVPMIMSFFLAFLIFTNQISIALILFSVVVIGIANAFDTPFRHAFLIDMIGDKKLLQNAIALNSTLFNSARFIGPTIGGFMIAFFGEAVCFLFNGVSFIGVIIALMAMRLSLSKAAKPKGSVFANLKEGLRYTYNFVPVRYLILLVMTSSFFGLPFQAFLPVFAGDILMGDSQLLGLLVGSVGAGALTGAFYLASRSNVQGIPRLISMTALLFAIALMAFSITTSKWLAMPLLFVAGFGMIVQFASTNTLLQTVVAEDKRGRVMSLYGLSFMGITPLGSLLIGSVASGFGVPLTLLVSAAVCLVSAFLFLRKLKVVREMTAQHLQT